MLMNRGCGPELNEMMERKPKKSSKSGKETEDAFHTSSTFLQARLDLGRPVKTTEWSKEIVCEGFRSGTRLTPNMFPWILEEAVKEAVETLHLGNILHTMRLTSVEDCLKEKSTCSLLHERRRV
eukprot:1451952-Amphidinium_carterae.9